MWGGSIQILPDILYSSVSHIYVEWPLCLQIVLIYLSYCVVYTEAIWEPLNMNMEH